MGQEENGAMWTRASVRMQNPSMECFTPLSPVNRPVFATDTLILWVQVIPVEISAILKKMQIVLTVNHTIVE